jgi:hypothetical protein
MFIPDWAENKHQGRPKYSDMLGRLVGEWSAPIRTKAFEYLRDKNIKTVLDCGANVGYFTDLVLEKLNPDKVFSVETDSENFAILL